MGFLCLSRRGGRRRVAAMKRFLPLIFLIAMPIIGLVLGLMVAESMHPTPEMPEGSDAVAMGRWVDQILEIQDKRGKVQQSSIRERHERQSNRKEDKSSPNPRTNLLHEGRSGLPNGTSVVIMDLFACPT